VSQDLEGDQSMKIAPAVDKVRTSNHAHVKVWTHHVSTELGYSGQRVGVPRLHGRARRIIPTDIHAVDGGVTGRRVRQRGMQASLDRRVQQPQGAGHDRADRRLRLGERNEGGRDERKGEHRRRCVGSEPASHAPGAGLIASARVAYGERWIVPLMADVMPREDQEHAGAAPGAVPGVVEIKLVAVPVGRRHRHRVGISNAAFSRAQRALPARACVMQVARRSRHAW
jgi:hypothetical protein